MDHKVPQLEPKHKSPHGVTKVLLADPECLVRTALAHLIDSLDEYEVVGTAGTAEEALHQLVSSQAECLVLEISFFGKSGIEILFEMKRNGSAVKSLVVSGQDNEQIVRQAMAAGANGYVLKRSSFECFCQGLQCVSNGKRFLSPELEKFAPDGVDSHAGCLDTAERDPLGILSPREREIFHHLASGLQNSVIAKRLYISPRTVETHRARVVRKLGLNSNAELIRFAIKNGLTVV